MLLAQLVVRTDDATLEQAPRAFDGLRVNLAAHPFLVTVIDALVPGVGVSDATIGGPLVGVDVLGALMW